MHDPGAVPTSGNPPLAGQPRRRLLRIYMSLALCLVVGVGLGSWIYIESRPGAFPSRIVTAAAFPLYYPKGIPIDQSSLQLSDNDHLLSYTLHFRGHVMYVTIQPRPSAIDLPAFSKQITDQTQFLTANGTATVGIFGGRKVGNLPAADSWVLISATLNTPSSDMAYVLRQLVQT
jgi:hypothetical protein